MFLFLIQIIYILQSTLQIFIILAKILKRIVILDPLFLHVNHDACPMIIINIDNKVNVLQIENIIPRCLLYSFRNVNIIVPPTKCCIGIHLIKQILKKNEKMNQIHFCPFSCSHQVSSCCARYSLQ